MTFTQGYFLNLKSSRSLGTSCINAPQEPYSNVSTGEQLKSLRQRTILQLQNFRRRSVSHSSLVAEVREFYEYGTLDRKEAVLSRSLLQKLEEEGVKGLIDLLSL